jgi:hypothetical protein
MRKQPLARQQPGAPPIGMPAGGGSAPAHPLLRLQQAVGNRAAAGAMDAAALEGLPPAPAVRTPAAKPVPCTGCVGGGRGPVVRR